MLCATVLLQVEILRNVESVLLLKCIAGCIRVNISESQAKVDNGLYKLQLQNLTA